MVRAILSGAKTQTRRVVKPQPTPNGGGPVVMQTQSGFFNANGLPIVCPYGQPGDRLWVREKWQPKSPYWFNILKSGEDRSSEAIEYAVQFAATCPSPGLQGRWRSSIHMPRWASRITLEVMGVRVERLQDISEADAMTEGSDCVTWSGIKGTAADLIDWPLKEVNNPYRNGYAVMWESISGPGSWDKNPWVWVVEFKQVEGEA
jgi:hypothetical protein